MFKKILLTAGLIILLAPVVVFAEEGEGKAGKKEAIETSGEIKIGVQQVDEKEADSSKFNEYRDIKDGLYLYKFNVEGTDNASGRYLEFKGSDVGRKDQDFKLRLGQPGKWGIEAEWDEIPHLISNKAQTPYNYQGNGLYTVPVTAGIELTREDTAYVISPGVFGTNAAGGGATTANDTTLANYLNSYAQPTDLGTERKKGSVALTYSPAASLKFRLSYSDEKKEGSQITGAALDDRPRRSLDALIPEPVDYVTRDLKFEAAYTGEAAQANFSYLLSKFENNVKALTWQNIYTDPVVGGLDGYSTFHCDTPANCPAGPGGDGTKGYIANYGRMALYPDNNYQNATLTFGLNLPMDSRLTATASYGMMKQDETLLPYSISTLGSDYNSTGRLPETTANAEIDTTMINLNYTINPVSGLNVQPFYRYYDMNNKTASQQWDYLTQDTRSQSVDDDGYSQGPIHKRVNLPYGYTKQNYGLDASYGIMKSTVGLGYEREGIHRDQREVADTHEDMLKASLNSRLTNWLSFKAKYLHGDRKGDTPDDAATRQGYWYSQTELETPENDPKYNYVNPADARRFDVSDRKRDQWQVSAYVKPMDVVDLSGSYMHRKDDFDSGVTSTAVTIKQTNYMTGDETYNTVGQQLGLLSSEANNYTADLNYAPTENLRLNAGYGRQEDMRLQRSSAALEDFKWNGAGWCDTCLADSADPTTVVNGVDYLWKAETRDNTDTIGVGGSYVIIPRKLNFTFGYSYSFGTVDITYSGFAANTADLTSGTPDHAVEEYYGFRSPEKVSHKQNTVNASLEYKMINNWIIGLNYLFDKYEIKDWMQGPSGGWVEQGGSDYLLRDSSQVGEWGDRLVTMGNYLGPNYENHVGMVTLAYKW